MTRLPATTARAYPYFSSQMPPENTRMPAFSMLMALITPPPDGDLTPDRGQCALQRERLCVQGSSHDRPFHAVGHERSECGQVVEGGDAAAGHDRPVGTGADLLEQLQVGALEGAVLGHVGDHVAGAAVGLQPVEDLPQVAGVLGPAAGGERGAADVQAHG